jgi:hypothetical protein
MNAAANSNSTAYSFYIPRIMSHHSESDVAQIFAYYGIGNVLRVDFTPIHQKPGFAPEDQNEIRTAFVHCDALYNTQLTCSIIETIETGASYRFYVSTGQYWLILKNRAPVSATMFNKHQIVDNCRTLEQQIQVLTSKNEMLEATVAKQADDIARVLQLVNQLIGLQQDDMNYKYDEYDKWITHSLLDDEPLGQQQQHQTERAFWDQLEEKMGPGLTLQDLEVEASVSTHSSMPALVSLSTNGQEDQEDEEDQEDDNSDLTWLDDYEVHVVEEEEEVKSTKSSTTSTHSNSISERMRFTAELCDNN